MNRRQFLRSLIAGVVSTTLTDVDVDKLLLQTSHLTDEQFEFQAVYYIRMMFNLEVINPARCVIITNIEEPSDEET